MSEHMAEIVNFILFIVDKWGYLGIFILMTIESSFIPLPSEVVIIPAGYLVYHGKMSAYMVLISGVAGSIAGALFNYYFAMQLGRRFLHKYGKYFFVEEGHLIKVELFFRDHGSFSTFTGRLIPMVRHLISIPAGLARMNMTKFITYTALGSCIWVFILILLGYFLGQNEALIKQYLHTITIALLVSIAVAAVIYVYWHKKCAKKAIISK